MTDLEPTKEVWRWAWNQARHHRSRFVVGGAVFAVLVLVAGKEIPEDWGTSFEVSAIALGMGIAGVVVVALAYALVVAPYEQRNELRIRLVGADVAFRAIKDTTLEAPLSEAHSFDLKRIIEILYRSVKSQTRFDTVSVSDRFAVTAHFPHLDEQLAKWDAAIQYCADTSEKLRWYLWKEVGDRGLLEPTYKREDLVTVLHSGICSATESAQSPFPQLDFLGYNNWIELNGTKLIISFKPLSKASLDHLLKPIRELWLDSESWPVTRDYASRVVDSGWPFLHNPLLEDLDRLLKRDHFKKGNGCERCV